MHIFIYKILTFNFKNYYSQSKGTFVFHQKHTIGLQCLVFLPTLYLTQIWSIFSKVMLFSIKYFPVSVPVLT